MFGVSSTSLLPSTVATGRSANTSASLWVRSVCKALNLSTTKMDCVSTNVFLNKIFQKLRRLSKEGLRQFANNMADSIPSLKGRNLLGNLPVFLAVLVRKIGGRKRIVFSQNLVPECAPPEVVTLGNITVVRDIYPKVMTASVIKGLIHMFDTYYRAHTFEFDSVLKHARLGESTKPADMEKDTLVLNSRFRWWDFQLRLNQNDATLTSVRQKIRQFLTFVLGFKNPISDECIFSLFVTPTGEVTSITSIINSHAMTPTMCSVILKNVLLYNNDDTPTNYVTNNTKNPLTNVTIGEFELEDYRKTVRRILVTARVCQ